MIKKIYVLALVIQTVYSFASKVSDESLHILRNVDPETVKLIFTENGGMNEMGVQAYGEACVKRDKNLFFGGVCQVQRNLSEIERRIAPITMSLEELSVSLRECRENTSVKKYFAILRTGKVGEAGHWYLFMADLNRALAQREKYYIFNPTSMGGDLSRLASMKDSMAIVNGYMEAEAECFMLGIQDRDMDCGGAVLTLMNVLCDCCLDNEYHALSAIRYIEYIDQMKQYGFFENAVDSALESLIQFYKK
ncbi:MAG: hypothetical protein C0432_04245 [Candidatus Puniceispirillum sp.]|nr:hypothetical protein [Candidatus Pelagibacter sp.]MBA4283486.1 hypothetical protein [Candidatus Puniceispirillum sp.]